MYKDAHSAEYFGEAIVNATRELTNHIWGHTKRERIDAIKTFLSTASDTLGIPTPAFVFIEGNEGDRLYGIHGGGQTITTTDTETGEFVSTIYMYKKFSLTTLLHEFRHCQQDSGMLTQADVDHIIELGDDHEEDAREWSCSLYFVTDPTRYMRAVTSGKLRHA